VECSRAMRLNHEIKRLERPAHVAVRRIILGAVPFSRYRRTLNRNADSGSSTVRAKRVVLPDLGRLLGRGVDSSVAKFFFGRADKNLTKCSTRLRSSSLSNTASRHNFFKKERSRTADCELMRLEPFETDTNGRFGAIAHFWFEETLLRLQ
jgi:hypothetical protein